MEGREARNATRPGLRQRPAITSSPRTPQPRIGEGWQPMAYPQLQIPVFWGIVSTSTKKGCIYRGKLGFKKREKHKKQAGTWSKGYPPFLGKWKPNVGPLFLSKSCALDSSVAYTPTPNTRLFRVSCGPSTKTGVGIYHGSPGFSTNTN